MASPACAELVTPRSSRRADRGTAQPRGHGGILMAQDGLPLNHRGKHEDVLLCTQPGFFTRKSLKLGSPAEIQHSRWIAQRSLGEQSHTWMAVTARLRGPKGHLSVRRRTKKATHFLGFPILGFWGPPKLPRLLQAGVSPIPSNKHGSAQTLFPKESLPKEVCPLL